MKPHIDSPDDATEKVSLSYPEKQMLLEGNDSHVVLITPLNAADEDNAKKTLCETEGEVGAKEDEEDRLQWTHSFEFVLSLIGYAVGVSNLWRFPYLCLRNGGGAFLIPFFLFLFLAGIPLFYMEVCLGQFSGTSSLFVWKLCPLFRGIGYCMILVSGMACIYYNGVLSWILYYLVSSFTSELPWASCGHWWNTPTCIDPRKGSVGPHCNVSTLSGNDSAPDNTTSAPFNLVRESVSWMLSNDTLDWTENCSSILDANDTRGGKTAAEEFWQYNVLRKTSGLHELGSLQLHSSLCLLAAWVLVFFCLIRGVKSLGKVWIEACLQVFYSLGPAWGGLITMASFNKFHNNCFRDAVIASLADGLTSFYGGFVIFGVVGFMAKEANTTVDKIATHGPGLALVAYPEAISKLPLPPLWAILFFVMLLSLGLDSQFGMFETVITGLVDAFPTKLRRLRGRLTFALCIACYLVSLPIATNGGIYVFQLLDWYVATFCVLLTSFLECIIIGWIYGIERFCTDVELMLGSRPSLAVKLCWCFVTPFLMLMAFIFTCATYVLPVYDDYVYPAEANALGFFISVLPLLPIPFFMVKELMSHEGSLLERLKKSLQPDASWGPALKEYRPLYVQRLPTKRTKFISHFRRTKQAPSVGAKSS
ncbi:hypothetical protein C0Q70_18917 [Pomacea canaliculata]|uniref:Transporter n=1 Tax=Pomacea canaliculata TaxID=400727 RepID=A0A2T7NHX4_POMCA|nr:hypothetical protein C0Q70_18917 [Pomacea canaliculata]